MKKLLLLGACAFLLASCGQEESNNAGTSSEETTDQASSIEQSSSEGTITSAEQPQEILTLGLSEPVALYLDNSEETVAEVVVTKVTDNLDAFPDYMKSGDYYDVNSLILIQVDYTNIAYSENLSFGLYDFQVFSEDGNLLPNIGQQNGGDSVAQDRIGTSEFYVETEKIQDKVELDFIPEGSNSPIATYSVDVEH